MLVVRIGCYLRCKYGDDEDSSGAIIKDMEVRSARHRIKDVVRSGWYVNL